MKAYGTVDGHSHSSAKSKPGRQQRNGPVETLLVHPDVWSLARILADGNYARIINRTSTSVVVANHEH